MIGNLLKSIQYIKVTITESNPNNYRPISVISTVAKVMERIVYDQFYSYLTDKKLLTKYQSGFRSLHSTVTALLGATNQCYFNIDNDMVTAVVFLDLAKAFDTIDHTILLKKLNLYGVHENTVKWFHSYLTGRQQKCEVNGTLSESSFISTGVPRGSISGPLLFLLYINDLPCCLKHSKARMYADDTNITTSASNFNDTEKLVNEDLDSIKQWLLANKLSINVTKTEYILVCSKYKSAQFTRPLNIKLGSDSIERVDASKSLGIYIDEHLTWSAHIDYSAKKISSALGGLKQIRAYVPIDT